ncbi:MAG: epoxyqueuosine reductase [Anaerolineae bacterium]|nr:epoxyqueuosine reductase [Anaerolineae bacterium]
MNRRLQSLAETWGADFFGVADLSLAYESIRDQGGPEIAAYPRAISVGISLFDGIVDQLPRRAERAVAVNYRHHAYDLVNQRLDLLVSRLSSVLQGEGHQVYPVPASKSVDDERLCGIFSHKLAAHLAGMGWIGKSCLLVTPQRGPRVRWATILTTAPLEPAGAPMAERCGNCTQCVDACPVGAFNGEPFRAGEPREVRFDAHACDHYFDELQADGRVAVCGLCLYVCPHGRK